MLSTCSNLHTHSDAEFSGKLERTDNSISDHKVVTDSDQLIEPQMIMNKPGMIGCLNCNVCYVCIIFLNRIFISKEILQFVIPEFNS